ncbi:MAG TPA: hypothetical protein VK171_07915 [Fimbriimonas sp.]|nr:hypothetical protein [Fimbriimonas sp.]
MLETPTRGRYSRERYLVFEPEPVYMILVYGCIAGGLGFLAIGYHSWIPAAVALSGIWAHFSVVRMRFDLRNRTYIRQQGPGFIPRRWRGSIDDLDAVVVIAEPSVTSSTVRYHLVLHWKQGRAPLMVLETQVMPMPPHLQMGGQALVARANQFGQSLKLPVYDNTHFPSKCPIPVF